MNKNLFKKLTMSAILLIGLLAISDTGVFAQNERDDDDKPTAEMVKQAKITMEQAKATALQKVPGEIIEGELEMEKGKLVYSFDIKAADGKIMEVWIDAKNGKILRASEDTEDDDDHADGNNAKMDDDDEDESPEAKRANIAKYSKEAKITMEQAKAIALKRVPGVITDEDLEKERGRLQYAFDIKSADGKVFDVEVDAKTGKIIKAVLDTEDDDDDN